MPKDVAYDILGFRGKSPRCQNPMLKDVAYDIPGFGGKSPRCQNPILKDVAYDIPGFGGKSPRCQNPMLKVAHDVAYDILKDGDRIWGKIPEMPESYAEG